MTWDGRPQNPERSGWHWMTGTADGGVGEFTAYWHANEQGWNGDFWTPEQFLAGFDEPVIYLGAALLPAEVAAAVLAEREACAALIEHQSQDHTLEEVDGQRCHVIRNLTASEQAAAILARPAPAGADALAAAVAQARREGIEAALHIVVGLMNIQRSKNLPDDYAALETTIRALLDAPAPDAASKPVVLETGQAWMNRATGDVRTRRWPDAELAQDFAAWTEGKSDAG